MTKDKKVAVVFNITLLVSYTHALHTYSKHTHTHTHTLSECFKIIGNHCFRMFFFVQNIPLIKIL